MDLLAGVVAIGGLVYNLCSRQCEQNALNKELKQLIEQIKNCEKCLDENQEIFNGQQFQALTPSSHKNEIVDLQETALLQSKDDCTLLDLKKEAKTELLNCSEMNKKGFKQVVSTAVKRLNQPKPRVQKEISVDANHDGFTNQTSRVDIEKVSKNPFFNYLHECRIHRRSENYRQMVKRAGKDWNKMPYELKCKYTKAAIGNCFQS